MAFLFKLEHEDGTPAEPPTLTVSVPNIGPGDRIPLGKRTLRVIGKRETTPTSHRCWSWRTRLIEPLGAQAIST